MGKRAGENIEIEKKCQNCQNTFIVCCVIDGSGSTGKLRKKYCSKQCKRDFNNTHKTSMLKIEFVCKICEKIFYRPPSQSIGATTCSDECRFVLLKLKGEEQRKRHFVTKCLICDNTFTHFDKEANQKFCSPKCFSLARRIKRIEMKCIICDDSIFVTQRRLSNSKTKKFCCSRKCQFHAQSSGDIKVWSNGRTGYRIDLNDGNYYKSSLEADYARYCTFFAKEYLFEPRTFVLEIDGNPKNYTPDFYFEDEDRFVELKGARPNSSFGKLQSKNLIAAETLIKQGIKVEIIFMNDFYDKLKADGTWKLIPNLEYRDYDGTKYLLRKRKD